MKITYWDAIEPLFHQVRIGETAEAFLSSIADVPRPELLVWSAHLCIAEVYNGGFLQFFWNSTGMIAPEAVAGLNAMGMHKLGALLEEAMHPLGKPYPRERDDRWDALLVGSGKTVPELESIFERETIQYLAFAASTADLGFEIMENRFYELAREENGGFDIAATAWLDHTLH